MTIDVPTAESGGGGEWYQGKGDGSGLEMHDSKIEGDGE